MSDEAWRARYDWPPYKHPPAIRAALGLPCAAHGRAVCRSCALEAWCFRAIADALFGWIP